MTAPFRLEGNGALRTVITGQNPIIDGGAIISDGKRLPLWAPDWEAARAALRRNM